MDLPTLKRLKNTIIGNPTAKNLLVQDDDFLHSLLAALNDPPMPTPALGLDQSSLSPLKWELRTETAHVVASLACGSPDVLGPLLLHRAHHALIFALAHETPSDPPSLRASLARALRMFACASANVAWPGQWGLRPELHTCKADARAALDYLFEAPALDVMLPLLTCPQTPVRIALAHTLAGALRQHAHRVAAAGWLPPADRRAAAVGKGKRGWEKPPVHAADAPTRGGGWATRTLTEWLKVSDVKVQEAALLAIAELARENTAVASMLVHQTDKEGPSCLTLALNLCKSKIIDVQLAACLCVTQIIRADPTTSTFIVHTPPSPALTVLHTLLRVLSTASFPAAVRARAAFTLQQLVTDDSVLAEEACVRGVASRLASIVADLAPPDPVPVDWDASEAAGVGSLREGCLTALAALSVSSDDLRRTMLSLPGIPRALCAALAPRGHVGARYAACQCVRVLARAVAVVRTGIVDSGVGRGVVKVFLRGVGTLVKDPPTEGASVSLGKSASEGVMARTAPKAKAPVDPREEVDEGWMEDRRVVWAALAAVCNLVADFSPLREDLLTDEALGRLVQLVSGRDTQLRVNALWALKNLLFKASADVKRGVMARLGWPALVECLGDADVEVQEQALHILRHLADREEDVELVMQLVGAEVLLDALSRALDADNEDVQCQAACLLANLANGLPSHQALLLQHPRIPHALRRLLSAPAVRVRRPAVGAVLQLARGAAANPRRQRELRELGLESTLRHLCGAGAGAPHGVGAVAAVVGGGLGTPVSPVAHTHLHGFVGYNGMMGVESDREVRENARAALYLLEHDAET